MLCALKSAGIQIPASVLLEGDAEAVGIQLAAFSNVAIDRPKSCNEQNLRAYARHVAASLLVNMSLIRASRFAVSCRLLRRELPPYDLAHQLAIHASAGGLKVGHDRLHDGAHVL